MRKYNIDFSPNYPQIIHTDILQRVANGQHTMANMTYYNKDSEPDKLHEEIIIESRFKNLCDSYTKTFNISMDDINQLNIFLNISKFGNLMFQNEINKLPELLKLAEKIVREQFNISVNEVIFDIDITPKIKLPSSINKSKKIEYDFKQSTNLDVLKKRTINALSQGAAKKTHYIFHMYRDEIDKIDTKLIESYQKSLVSNDLIYFIMNDDDFYNIINHTDNINAGYSLIKYENSKPVIVAKALSMPLLIHEMVKALITLFSLPGIQNMDQHLIDETDFIISELWEIRFGPILWEKFNFLIDISDYDIRKLIIIELFKMDSDYFINVFMKNVLNYPDLAQKDIKLIVKKIRSKINDFYLNQNYD